MDQMERTAAGQTSTPYGRTGQLVQGRMAAQARPVLWTGLDLDRECSELVPTLWDGNRLA